MADANVAVRFTADVGDLVSGVGEARDALASSRPPFDALNGQSATLAGSMAATSTRRACKPYDAALATSAAHRALARRRSRRRRRQAIKAADAAASADAMRAAREAITGGVARRSRTGLKQKLALYADEARQHEITQQQKVGAVATGAGRRISPPELAALQQEGALGQQSLAQKTAHRRTDPRRRAAPSGPDRRPDPQSARRTGSSEYQALRRHDDAGLQFAIARPALGDGELAHGVQERARGPADQVHRMGRGDGRATGRDRGGQDRGDDRRRRRRAPAPNKPAPRLRSRRRRRSMVRSILSSAAEAFAGVFGFLAPIMGPFAAGPADGGAGDRRRHGRRGRLGRHRHVAGARRTC